ncbi:hypothetical protein RvY_05139 [Ramazzottius varieornatus]|uniref:Uncharacterized protein n=1 Tax=Ramazzottius varieornatus TaxID=947166 RepID=A0A1D1UU03_RAMVA|nr:hypothetical protein RvY_05139 [Ramazzottius varieornatus]
MSLLVCVLRSDMISIRLCMSLYPVGRSLIYVYGNRVCVVEVAATNRYKLVIPCLPYRAGEAFGKLSAGTLGSSRLIFPAIRALELIYLEICARYLTSALCSCFGGWLTTCTLLRARSSTTVNRPCASYS